MHTDKLNFVLSKENVGYEGGDGLEKKKNVSPVSYNTTAMINTCQEYEADSILVAENDSIYSMNNIVCIYSVT